MCRGVLPAHVEARRGLLIPWGQSYRWMGAIMYMLGNELGLSTSTPNH